MPAAFEQLYGEGPYGCSFSSSACSVTCKSPPPTGVDAGVGPGPDGGTTGTGDAGTTGPLETPACAACCEPCASDPDCCPGSACGQIEGVKRCVPSDCYGCTYGCTFRCP